jgi:hypothetical protein
MINKPKIYTLNCEAWIENLNTKSMKVQQPKCPVCNRLLKEEIKYSKVELEIEKYNGEDMVSASNILMISKELFTALVQAGIKEFAPLKVDKVKYRHSDVAIKNVPELVYLAVLSPPIRNIPIASDFIGICEGCNLYLNKYNMEKSELIIRSSEENAIELQAYYESYQGADIFNFADHGETGITQKFLDVTKNFNCPDIVVIPAGWI